MKIRAGTISVIILLLAACTDKQVVNVCDIYRLSYSLTNSDYERCLEDKIYRAGLKNKRNKLRASLITSIYNKNLKIIALKGIDRDAFVRINSPSEIPVTMLDRGEPEEPDLRGRFVLTGVIDASDEIGFIYDLESTSDRHSEINYKWYIHFDALNNYQKSFLAESCRFLKYKSMCQGELFIEVRRNPGWSIYSINPQEGLFVSELVGADFQSAKETDVFQSLQP